MAERIAAKITAVRPLIVPLQVELVEGQVRLVEVLVDRKVRSMAREVAIRAARLLMEAAPIGGTAEEGRRGTALRDQLRDAFVEQTVVDVASGSSTAAAEYFALCLEVYGPQPHDELSRLTWERQLSAAVAKPIKSLLQKAGAEHVHAFGTSSLQFLHDSGVSDKAIATYQRGWVQLWETEAADRQYLKDFAGARRALALALAIWDTIFPALPDAREDQVDLFDLLRKYAEACSKDGDPEAAKTSYRRATDVADKFMTATFDDDTRRQNVGYVLDQLARLYVADGAIADAEDCYRRALEYDRAWAKAKPDSAKANEMLGYSLGGMASICKQQGDTAGARAYRRERVELAEKLAARLPIDSDVSQALAKAYEGIGNSDEPAEAYDAWKKALAIYLKKMESEWDATEAMRAAAEAYEWLGDLAIRLGEALPARDYSLRCVDLKIRLLDIDKETAEAKATLAFGELWLGRTAFKAGYGDQARLAFEKCLELRRQAAESKPQDASAHDKVLDGYEELAKFLTDCGDAREARRLIRDGLELRREGPGQNARATLRSIAAAYNALGEALLELHDVTGARAEFRRSFEIRQKLADKVPEVLESKTDLANSYVHLARAERRDGNFADAAKWLKHSLELLHELESAKKLADPANQKLLHDQERWLAAFEKAPRAIEDLEFARRQTPRETAVDLLTLRAEVLAHKGDIKGALAAVAALRDLAPKDKDNLFDAARCYALVLRVLCKGRTKDQLTKEERSLRDDCAAKALDALAAAIEKGFDDGARLLSENELDILRSEDAYRDLIEHFKNKSISPQTQTR